jgi:hypothetical protein
VKDWFARRGADAVAFTALAMTGAFLFRHHLLREGVLIGDADRLNTFLNILTHQVDGIRHGGLAAWDERMFMGLNTAALVYTFPNPLTYLVALAPEKHLFWAAGLVSLALFMSAGWAAYAFSKDSCGNVFAAWVGATTYQCSALATLKLVQNDMSFAVLILLPLALLALRRVSSANRTRCLVSLAVVLASMLYFTFLQKVLYGLGLVCAYALYRAFWTRSAAPVLTATGAGAIAVIAAFPRLWTVARELQWVERPAVSYQPGNFDSLYEFQNIRPREILRWFDDGIFGRSPGEAAALGNNINLHEGLLLYTSTVAALLVLIAVIRFKGQWLRLLRFRDEDAPFHVVALAITLAVVLVKPATHLVYLAFFSRDFTHARIVVAGLLPMCTLVAIVLASRLGDWDLRRVRARSVAVLGVVLAAAVVVVASLDSLARHIREPYPVLLNEPPGYLARTIARLALGKTTDGMPSVPKGLSAIRTEPGQVRLAWQDGAGETQYWVEMRSRGGQFRHIGSTGPNVTAYVVAQLDANSLYAFRLRACRRERCSPYSAEVGAEPGRSGTVADAEPHAAVSWLVPGEVVKMVYITAILGALVLVGRVARAVPIRVIVWQFVGLLIAVQAIAHADTRLNGEETRSGETPFAGNNLLFAVPDDFQHPSEELRERLARRVERDDFRTVIVCEPQRFGTFCAPHVSHFWDMRLVDGYSTGVPARLAMLPWPTGILSLRALTFSSVNALPWDLLALLNVKYALVARADWYANHRDGERRVRDVDIVANPRPVTPRVFFARTVTAVRGRQEALRALTQTGASGVLRNVVTDSVVENYEGPTRLVEGGVLSTTWASDRIDIHMTPAAEPRFLVLNELYHPDWIAEIGDRAVTVYPTNVVMRGVLMPAGADRIRFTFRPFVRPATMALFGASALITACGVAWLLRHERQ